MDLAENSCSSNIEGVGKNTRVCTSNRIPGPHVACSYPNTPHARSLDTTVPYRFHLQVIILTLLYSWAGLGIAIVNDFKSVEGDREMGLQSLPVAFGVEKAKWICVASIDATQLGIAAWLYSIGEPTYAAVLTGLVLPQIFAQFKYFLPDPVGNDVK